MEETKSSILRRCKPVEEGKTVGAKLRAKEIHLGDISTEKVLQPREWMRPPRETEGGA